MNRKVYHHVIVLGIDGAGGFIEKANTPSFDRIFENGALTYKALSSKPTISAECWGSMIFGTSPRVHGLTNKIVVAEKYPDDSEIPSLFKRIRTKMPDAKLGAFCDWSYIAYGMIESNVGVTIVGERDNALPPLICNYIQNEKPTFLFIQFDSVDGVGHSKGYGSPEQLQRISKIDVSLGKIFDAVKDAEMLDDTLFIVISDHGGKGFSHGGWSDDEKYVTLALTGSSVAKGLIPCANVRDLAAIVLYALGIEQPVISKDAWTSQVPSGVFEECMTRDYRFFDDEEIPESWISRKQHTSELST